LRILVIGAAGRIGRIVVEKALGHGHDVRAFVHQTPLALAHPRLEVVSGDVVRFEDVERAVTGCDAVVFAVASGGARDSRIHSEGVGHVLHAMAAHEVTRLAAVSAAGVFARKDPHLSVGFKAMISTVLRATYDDLERMEQRVAASGVSWTIVRPVGLSDAPSTGHYRVSLDGSILPKSARIPRTDVASVLLKAVETGTFDRHTLLIAQ